MFDAGADVKWQTAEWNGTTPAGTSVVLSIRIGPTPIPGKLWTPFTPVSTTELPVTGPLSIDVSRYVQYRLELATTDPNQAPVVRDVTVTFVR